MAKTIRVRIAVAVNERGECGSSMSHDGDDASARSFALDMLGEKSELLEHVVFVEADIPLPESLVVVGSVSTPVLEDDNEEALAEREPGIPE